MSGRADACGARGACGTWPRARSVARGASETRGACGTRSVARGASDTRSISRATCSVSRGHLFRLAGHVALLGPRATLRPFITARPTAVQERANERARAVSPADGAHLPTALEGHLLRGRASLAALEGHLLGAPLCRPSAFLFLACCPFSLSRLLPSLARSHRARSRSRLLSSLASRLVSRPHLLPPPPLSLARLLPLALARDRAHLSPLSCCKARNAHLPALLLQGPPARSLAARPTCPLSCRNAHLPATLAATPATPTCPQPWPQRPQRPPSRNPPLSPCIRRLERTGAAPLSTFSHQRARPLSRPSRINGRGPSRDLLASTGAAPRATFSHQRARLLSRPSRINGRGPSRDLLASTGAAPLATFSHQNARASS